MSSNYQSKHSHDNRSHRPSRHKLIIIIISTIISIGLILFVTSIDKIQKIVSSNQSDSVKKQTTSPTSNVKNYAYKVEISDLQKNFTYWQSISNKPSGGRAWSGYGYKMTFSKSGGTAQAFGSAGNGATTGTISTLKTIKTKTIKIYNVNVSRPSDVPEVRKVKVNTSFKMTLDNKTVTGYAFYYQKGVAHIVLPASIDFHGSELPRNTLVEYSPESATDSAEDSTSDSADSVSESSSAIASDSASRPLNKKQQAILDWQADRAEKIGYAAASTVFLTQNWSVKNINMDDVLATVTVYKDTDGKTGHVELDSSVLSAGNHAMSPDLGHVDGVMYTYLYLANGAVYSINSDTKDYVAVLAKDHALANEWQAILANK